ncbi:MAG TPA: peroxidase family protein [Planctomycetota bacterium]|nr:peroxidase family protein [Planctomycetota bacterium]
MPDTTHFVFFAVTCLPTLLSAQLGPLPFRTIDGSSNNINHPTWGMANIELMRRAPVAYADGVSAPGGATRPSARAVSNALCAQDDQVPNAMGASDFVWQWGQFIDHDLDLTTALSPIEAFDIPVPIGDPFFDPLHTGTQTIALSRSVCEPDPLGVRQQMNVITSFLDGSMVYGSDAARALELRRLDGTGRLKTSAGDLLPFNVNAFPNAPVANDPTLFLAGDVRCNEQNGLTAMHTLFVREHNYWASTFGVWMPASDDETRYQLARAIVAGEIQAITYNEWLPVLLGPGALSPYAGYQASCDATVANEFSTACFRVGHTMLNKSLLRRDATGSEIAAGDLPLQLAFFNPGEIVAHGIDALLRGLAMQPAQEVDTLIVEDVRNFLFGPPGAGGFDLASLNLQRGRDHGLSSYNAMRVAYGLPARGSFKHITHDRRVVQVLENTYASVDDVDAWIGALAEDHVPGAMVGPLISAVLVDQFTRARDGDRFWYTSYLGAGLAAIIDTQTLAVIIRRNTSIGTELQDDVFLAPSN